MRPAVLANERERKKMLRWAKAPRTKEQRQRESEERVQKLKKERLMREVELGALNTKRYRTLWREMMMRIKMPQIAEDVEIAWRNFDRALDIKDYRISFLMDELAEAEEQYQRNVRSHAETIDHLLRMYRDRMRREEGNYQKILCGTLNQTDTEVSEINRQQNEDEILLQSITCAVQLQQEESLNNVKSITLSKIDTFVEESKNIQRISVTQLENQLQSTWEDLRRILSDYQNNNTGTGLDLRDYNSIEVHNHQFISQYDIIPETKYRRKCYEALKEKDEMNRQMIAQQVLRAANLFDEIRKLRGKIATYDGITKRNISEILIEHDFFQKAYWTVKNRFLSEQTKDEDQLKILSIEYNKIIKHLEHLVTKGTQLLVLMQICRKYETQREKIIPFAGHTEPENSLTSMHRISALPIIEDFQDLTNFWRRLGAAQVITIQLRSDRDKLRAQSNRLQECVNSYMLQKAREGK